MTGEDKEIHTNYDIIHGKGASLRIKTWKWNHTTNNCMETQPHYELRYWDATTLRVKILRRNHITSKYIDFLKITNE